MRKPLIFAFLCLATISTLSCSREPVEIEIVLPEGFRGLIDVIEVPSSTKAIEVGNKGYLLALPENGSIAVKSIDAFSEGPFLPVVRYANGKIVVVRPVQDKAYEGLAFWLINQPVGRRMVFFVGTRDELEGFDFEASGIYKISRRSYQNIGD